MNIEKIKIEDIKENPNNPRTISDPQFKKLVKSIEEFPKMLELRPLVLDKKNIVVGGNMRLRALKTLGYKEITIVRADTLSKKELERFIVVDNLPFGEWDKKALKESYGLDELEAWGFDTNKLGKTKTNENDDLVPEMPKEPKSKLGDLYEIGKHRIMCGDSTSKEDVEKLMEKAKADMVFTDPPYNVNYSGRGKNTSNTIKNDNMSQEQFFDFLTKVFERYNEISKKGAGWYIFHSSSTQKQFEEAIESVGWNVKNQIIWNKPVASMGWGDYRWKHEPMFYCGNEKTNFYGDRTHNTVLDIPEDDEEALKWLRNQKILESKGYTTIWSMKREKVNEYVHPTQKPVELIEYALNNSSKMDDIVSDLFLGSGATLIACEKLNRACYGMELDPVYADVCVQRLVDYTGIEKIKLNGKEIVWKKS